ncbi:uncharacterized protein OCT59_004936 [Rhizophagus irregularis]|nr:hypothetical protein OCT59_004936 [Rhizophagus irregularis]
MILWLFERVGICVSKFLKLSFCRFEWTEPSEEIK